MKQFKRVQYFCSEDRILSDFPYVYLTCHANFMPVENDTSPQCFKHVQQ